MYIWLAMAIPVLTAIILFCFYNRQMLWWEFVIPFAASAIMIACFKYGTEAIQTSDTEYWTGWMTNAEYYEEWDEEVPCRHPEYETTTDADGNTTTTFVGYEHMYDVDYHGPKWYIHDSNGFQLSIDRNQFEALVGKFGNKKFIELNRDYHSIDGNEYETVWPGSDSTLVPVCTIHSYENRVQASKSIFNFQEVDPKEFGLFEYPRINGYACQCILGDGGPSTAEAERILNVSNAKLGAKKRVRSMILIFHEKTLQAGLAQENYWKGGNKNEFILAIGVDKQNKVTWCHPISWTEADGLKVDARNEVISQLGQPLNLVPITNWMNTNVQAKYKHRSFKEFSYLTVEPPLWAIIVTFLVTIGLNILLSFFLVNNEFREYEDGYRNIFRR